MPAVALTVGEALVATVIIGILVMASGLVRPFADETGRPRSWPAAVRLFIYALGLMTIVAALLGYIGLARFISQQIVVDRRGSGDDVYRLPVVAGRVGGRGCSRARRSAHGSSAGSNWTMRALDQLSLLISILINVARRGRRPAAGSLPMGVPAGPTSPRGWDKIATGIAASARSRCH